MNQGHGIPAGIPHHQDEQGFPLQMEASAADLGLGGLVFHHWLNEGLKAPFFLYKLMQKLFLLFNKAVSRLNPSPLLASLFVFPFLFFLALLIHL